MKAAGFRFDSYGQRQDDRGMIASWLLTQQLAANSEFLAGMRMLCAICGKITALASFAPDQPVDAREGLCCADCGMNARLRAALGWIQDSADSSAHIYITEQCTRTYALLQSRFPNARGSEFEPDADRRAEMAEHLAALGGHGEINFEDVTRLGMADASVDIVASFDVLEHVPEYWVALREFARVLRPQGTLVATFPFTDAERTIVRASLSNDGEIVHHLEPEYHGDPVGGQVLCFQHFGWDVLRTTREAGFSRASMLMPWAPEQGIFYGNWMLVATR